MAGDLLHLIRGAEKKAEEIVQKATSESKELLKQANQYLPSPSFLYQLHH